MLILFLFIAQTYGKVFIQTNTTMGAADFIACSGLIFHEVYFDREVLFMNLGRPCNLAMHKFTGRLFFSHTIENGTHADFGITYCYINKKKCTDVKSVPGGYAIGYDTGNDDIYFGGHDGIYKYNFFNDKAEFYAEQGKSIWGLFVKRHFYYIEYPSQRLFVYQDDTFVKVAEAIDIEIDNFFISKHSDIYFSNKTALYKVEKATKDVIHLNDEVIVRQIVEDAYGDVYFVCSDGIYLEDKPYHSITRIALIDQAFGLTFDNNGRVIYSDKDAVYRLNPSKYKDLCYNAINAPKKEKMKTDKMSALKLAKAFMREGFFNE